MCCTWKFRLLILQGIMSLLCFNFTAQHMEMSFSSRSLLVLPRLMDLHRQQGKKKQHNLLGSEGKFFHFCLKCSLYNGTVLVNSRAFCLSPSTCFTNWIRTTEVRISWWEFDSHLLSWVRFTMQKLLIQCAH